MKYILHTTIYFKYFLNVHIYIFKRSENNSETGRLLNILMRKK